jgi:hypothetical protein
MTSEPSKAAKTFWISWYQPTSDPRPLKFPPNENVLGWWETGLRCSDKAITICALVLAGNKKSAERAIRLDWPEASEWRFCEEKEDAILSDRFPLNEWMSKRIAAYRKATGRE